MEVAFKLHLPREASSVPIARRLCRCSFRSLGVEEECVEDLELAVTEACTNVLKHASGLSDEYEIEVTTNGLSCELRVKDTGAGFDPANETPRPDVSAESGRGIELMRRLVDELQFVSHGSSGTIVHLTKTLRLREDALLVPSARAGERSSGSYTG